MLYGVVIVIAVLVAYLALGILSSQLASPFIFVPALACGMLLGMSASLSRAQRDLQIHAYHLEQLIPGRERID